MTLKLEEGAGPLNYSEKFGWILMQLELTLPQRETSNFGFALFIPEKSMLKSLYPDICSTNLPESKQFYASLFGMKPVFEINWYIQLQTDHDENVQIAFVAKDHPSVPQRFAVDPQGVVITLELDDVDSVYARAQEFKVPIVQELRDEEWGQRHFMVKDPNDLLVDVVKMIEPSEEFVKKYL